MEEGNTAKGLWSKEQSVRLDNSPIDSGNAEMILLLSFNRLTSSKFPMESGKLIRLFCKADSIDLKTGW